MTQTIIHSLLDIEKPIYTDLLVYVKEGKELPKDAIDKLATQSIVASKTFCPLTVKHHLDFDGADYILPLLEKEIISLQPKEKQKAYKKVIHYFFIKGEDWFVITKEEWEYFIDWVSPIMKSFQDCVEWHKHGQYETTILTPITLILLGMYQKTK